MNDKSLNGKQAPAPTEPAAPVSPETPETQPAINSVGTMLADRFAEIEKAKAAEATPEPEATPQLEPTQEPEPVIEPELEPEPEPELELVEEPEEIPELAKLPPEVQASINKRIGKITAIRKAAEEKIKVLELEKLELEGKLKNSGLSFDEAMAVTKAGLPAEYLNADEAKLVAKEQFLSKEVAWAFENLDGATIGDKEYSAKDMRRYYLRLKEEHDALMPQASALLKDRLTQYQQDLKTARDLRAKKAKLAAAPAKPPPPVKPATAIPPAATRKPLVSQSQAVKPTFDPDAMMKEGVTTDKLQEALERQFTRG